MATITLVAASGGGQQQQRQPETLSLQQLCKWVIRRGRSGPGAWDYPRARGTGQQRQQCQQRVSGSVGAAAQGVSESAAALGASETAATGASDSATSESAASAEALLTFTLESGSSRCFFRDCTTVIPLAAPVLVSLADPSGGPVIARASTVLPFLAVPSSSLSGFHLPSFSTNLQHGSSPYTLTTASAQVAASGQVAASSQVSASSQFAVSCPCRILSHPILLWHHRLGHPSLPRLRTMHSCLLVSGLPRSLPSLPRSRAPPCLPCVKGRQCVAPHSSFPPTTAPLQTLHIDVKAGARGVLIPWIGATRRQLRERFRRDLPVLRLHSVRGGEFSSGLLAELC
ncbi:unnamed protein product [Closterium sp. NIES-54]